MGLRMDGSLEKPAGAGAEGARRASAKSLRQKDRWNEADGVRPFRCDRAFHDRAAAVCFCRLEEAAIFFRERGAL